MKDYQKNKPSLWKEDLCWPAGDMNKYDRGHAVICGGEEKTGASRLAAIAALRAGAGLVSVTCPEKIFPVYASSLLSVMVKPIDNDKDFKKFLRDERKNAVLIGPGTGTGDKTRQAVLTALSLSRSCVVDADAITAFRDNPDALFAAIKKSDKPVILTPHEGEFERLFGVNDIDKKSKVAQAVQVSGAIVLLKGRETMIASPKGDITVNSNAPPTLATAGSGDVLAGIITGFLAAGMDADKAACAAVWIHGECANRIGVGLIAEDLPGEIPAVLEELC